MQHQAAGVQPFVAPWSSGGNHGLEHLPVAQLASMTAPYNPRRISDHDLAALRRSIHFFGTVEPVVVNRRSNRIVGGHQRVKAAQAEGLETFPVVWVDLDDPSEKQLNLALNRISGDWDDAKLREVLIALEAEGADLGLTGFDDAELQRLTQQARDGLTDPDATPEPPEVPVTQPGDLWVMGDHRLLCGDATKGEDVARVLGGEPVRLLVADPPYGMNLDSRYSGMPYTTRDFAPVTGDDQPFDAAPVRVLFQKAAQFWFGANYYARSLGDTEHRGAWLVWDKRVTENLDRGFGSCFELVWSSRQRKREILRFQWFQNHADNEPEARARLHPTQKPTDLVRWLLDTSSGSGDVVADPFLGSGTTLIAAEQLSRRCFGLEIEPRYCDVIVRRWEQFTGKTAERIEARDG